MEYQENQMAGASLGGRASDRAQRAEPMGEGPLDSITDRIERATLAAIEIGNKLNAHADRVHGPSGNKATGSGGIEHDTVRDRAPGALQQVFEAIANLDQAQNYLAEAAGRNSTLA